MAHKMVFMLRLQIFWLGFDSLRILKEFSLMVESRSSKSFVGVQFP